LILPSGSRLDPYEILAPLGAGGMGEVYRARDPRLDREVAVKVLPEAVAADPERLSRFQREAEAAEALNHPNILAVLDVGVQEARPYVVTELLEGDTLRGHLLQTEARREIASHGNRLLSLALGPTGQVLVTGSRDGLVRVGPLGGRLRCRRPSSRLRE